MTGMDVNYDVFPEDVYFDKVTAALSSGSEQYDAFMTGAYMTWQYGPAGWIVDLNEYIKDPAKTNPNYNWDDVLPNLRASTSWSGVPGAALGGDDAKQWASHGASSSTRSPTTGSTSTSSASSSPRICAELVEQAAKITKDRQAASTASASAARAPGRRSIRASSRLSRTTAQQRLQRHRRQAARRR